MSYLFGKHVTADAAIQLYAISKGGPFTAHRFDNVADATKFFEANRHKYTIYFNTSLMRPVAAGKRGSNDDAMVTPALFADLDAAEGEHSGDRATKAELMTMLTSGEVVPVPTFIIDSGGGYHAYWMLDEPITDYQVAIDRLTGLNDRIVAWSNKHGYKYERLKDTARVLRMPGSKNFKTSPPKPVEQVWPINNENLKVYTQAEVTFAPAEPAAKGDSVTADFDAPKMSSDEILQASIVACMKVEKQWGNDASSFVVKLCRQCVRKGCTPDQCVTVVKTIQGLTSFPGDWTAAKIIKRYEDAKTQSTLGEGLFRKYEPGEAGIAQRVADRTKGELLWVEERKTWYSWDGNRFVSSGEKAIFDAVMGVAGYMIDNPPDFEDDKDAKKWNNHWLKYYNCAGLVSAARVARGELSVSAEDFDTDPNVFHCSNGVLYLGSDVAFGPADPKLKNTKMSSVVYDKEATSPRWLKFIDEITLGDKELGIYLQSLMGYCLTGRTDDQSLYVMHGDGANGKSVFVNVVRKVLGEYATGIEQSVVLASRDQHFSATADLAGARFAVTEETDQGKWLNESQVKSLTGGGRVKARRLYEHSWEFEATHKLFITTNSIPVIRGSDNGIWRRVKLIPFNAKFKVGQEPGLEETLLSEASGILNWFIAGYKLYCSFEGIPEVAAVTTAVKEQKDEMDIVQQFVDDWCVVDPEARETNAKLLANFDAYCREQGHPLPRNGSTRWMLKDLGRKGFEPYRDMHARYRLGLRVKELSEFENEGKQPS